MHYFIVVMHVTFQNILSRLRYKVFLQYFNVVSALYMDKFYDFTASDLWQPLVKYICQETDLITFCLFFVLIFIKYNKVIDKQACRLGCKITLILLTRNSN